MIKRAHRLAAELRSHGDEISTAGVHLIARELVKVVEEIIAGVDSSMIERPAMRRTLRAAVKATGSQKAWAIANDVSEQYVCDCLKGRRDIGARISLALGYEPMTVYVKASLPPSSEEARSADASPLDQRECQANVESEEAHQRASGAFQSDAERKL